MEIFTLSLLLPLAYLSILIGSMATFSHLYRTRQITAKLRLSPYFPAHTTRNIYLSLLHLSDNDSSATEKQKVPDSVLRAALFARACEDIRRIREIQTRKPALAALLQRGVVGDEIFQRLTRAEQEMEMEIKDVMAEANALSGAGSGGAPGTWGQSIFQSANEMVQNGLLREKLEGWKGTLPAEKDRWERTRESARRELLGEKEDVPDTAAAITRIPVPASITTEQGQGAETVKKVTAGSSDEDGVIVETPALDLPTPGGTIGGGGKNKKKKGKK